ncbi:MAG: hypothetical protein ACFFDH_10650 [Promethearchaeota archaeon]
MKITIQGFLSGLRKLLRFNNIISLSGESGTGKSTIALFLAGKLLEEGEQCIWIQASERFPTVRMRQMFEGDPRKIEYLKNHIFITPKDHVIHTYEEQCTILLNLLSEGSILPLGFKFLVIDNISHQLRHKIAQSEHISHTSKILDQFYELLLMPLILFCKRNRIVLIILHEMTFDPKISQTRPFFYKLYDRIRVIDIRLEHIVNESKKNIGISLNNTNWNFLFDLIPSGIAIY